MALLRRPGAMAVLTGAGVSAGSGVPTFRGPGGLWRSHRPEDLATPEAFARDPVMVWEWYDWRRQRIAAAAPNAAHDVLARWSRRWPGVTLVTQNVDGLHERAGSRGVLRLHGSIWHVRCAEGCAPGQTSWRLDDAPLTTLPPPCRHCGGVARPDVVWFGEPLDAEVFDQALDAVARATTVLVVGTSAQVYPAAALIAHHAGRGARVIEINPDQTAMSDRADVLVRMPAEAALPAIDAALAE